MNAFLSILIFLVLAFSRHQRALAGPSASVKIIPLAGLQHDININDNLPNHYAIS